MALKQAVTTVFKSKDESVNANFKKMGKGADKFGERTSRAFKKASKSATSFGTITKGILAAGVVQKALGGISAGISSVTTDFLNFDQAITSASAKFKGLNLSTEKGRKTLEALKKTARDVGATTEFNAAQAAGGLDFLALAGFNAKQAMALLPGVTNLATVANVDLATATDIASDSLGAFGLMTSDSAQLAKNFTRVQDVMAKTTATSNTNLIDMFEAVKKGAPDFTAAGQSIETFSALIGVMANAGIKGSEAGTKLRNMAVRLAGPTKEAAGLLSSMGIKTADASGNYRDMLDIIDDVIKGTSKMGEVQKAAALKTIFGARQTGGLNVILKEGTKRLRSYRQMLTDSKGAAEKMAKIMRSSLINRLKSLGSAATEVGFQLFSAFDEQGAGAIDSLTQMIRRVDLKPMIDGIRSVAGIGKKLFDRFVEIGTQTGLFDKIKIAVDKVRPAISAMFENVKSLFNFLDKSGTLLILAESFKLVADASSLASDSIVKMFNTVKPILEKMDKLFEPVTKLITAENLKKASEIRKKSLETIIKPLTFAAGLGKTGFRAAFDPTFAAEQQQRNEAAKAAPETPERQAPPTQNFGFTGQLNIAGAPQGSTFEQRPGPTPINVSGLE